MASSGIEVRTIAQERVDKPDFDAKGQLVSGYIESILGALLGYGGGLLSPMKTTYTDDGVTYSVTLGPFHAYHCSRETYDPVINDYRTWLGKVLTHVPGGSQASTLDYTANRAAAVAADVIPTGIPAGTPGAFPFLWMRPTEVDTDTEGRRYWNGSGDAAVSMKVRTTTYLEFQFADSPPSSASGEWIPIAKIAAWAGAGTGIIGSPALYPLSAWDGGGLKGSSAFSDPHAVWDGGEDVWDNPDGNHSGASRLLYYLSSGGAGSSYDGYAPPQQNPTFGLIGLLYTMRRRFLRLLADDGSVNWLSAPAATLKALKALVDANTASSLANTSGLATINARPYICMSGIIDWDAAGGIYVVRALGATNSSPFNVGALVRSGVGSVSVSFLAGLPAGFLPVAVDTTPTLAHIGFANSQGKSTGADVFIYNANGVPTDGSFQITVWAREN